MIEELFVQAFKFFGTEIISHLFVISLPTIICGLLQKRPTWSASLLQLSHLNRTILPFSLLCLHHFTECFSLSQNNFSLSTFEFREIFAPPQPFTLCSDENGVALSHVLAPSFWHQITEPRERGSGVFW